MANKKSKKSLNQNQEEIPISNINDTDPHYVEYDGKEDFDVFFNRLEMVQKLAFVRGMLYGSLSYNDEGEETIVEDEEQFQIAVGILDTMIDNNCEV